ncbi:MAG: hypothetical protein WCD50_04530 [Onishia taeanensis]
MFEHGRFLVIAFVMGMVMGMVEVKTAKSSRCGYGLGEARMIPG